MERNRRIPGPGYPDRPALGKQVWDANSNVSLQQHPFEFKLKVLSMKLKDLLSADC